MPSLRRIIRSITELRRLYRELGPGDAVLGLLPLQPGEDVKILDLAFRGVAFYPPLLAQFLCRSKAAQAEVLAEFMVPGTFVAYTSRDLAAHLAPYASRGQVVCKRDQAHLGLGVSRWPSLEALLSFAGLQALSYPLVVQPFVEETRDLRVLVAGDYAETYERLNPHDFRKNLFQGGSARPAALASGELAFCRRAMARGSFPYAILDLLLSPAGEIFLSEINLKGGLKASRVGQAGFRELVHHLAEEYCRTWENSSKTPP